MKIGLVCPYNMFRGGGVQEHVFAQADELRKRGHTVKIITPRPRKFLQDCPDDMIFIGNSATIKTPIKTSLELGISMGRSTVDDLLAEEQFDLLHVHEPEVPVLGAQIIAKAEAPVVATFHAIHPDTPMARTIEAFRIPYARSIFSKLKEITAVSDVAAAFVHEHTGRKINIIPNGIDLAKYNLSHIKDPRKPDTVLYIGRLEKRKGVRYLLEAFAELQKEMPKVKLVLAGDGPDRERLEEYSHELGLKHVKFLGFVDEAKKLKLLATSTVFCSPALYGESFGIVLLEAMAMDTPVVAGDNPGYVSVMQGRGKLSLVDPKNKTSFSRRLCIFLEDQEVRDSWRAWAKDYVRDFDYTKVVDQYEELYRKVLKKR